MITQLMTGVVTLLVHVALSPQLFLYRLVHCDRATLICDPIPTAVLFPQQVRVQLASEVLMKAIKPCFTAPPFLTRFNELPYFLLVRR